MSIPATSMSDKALDRQKDSLASDNGRLSKLAL